MVVSARGVRINGARNGLRGFLVVWRSDKEATGCPRGPRSSWREPDAEGGEQGDGGRDTGRGYLRPVDSRRSAGRRPRRAHRHDHRARSQRDSHQCRERARWILPPTTGPGTPGRMGGDVQDGRRREGSGARTRAGSRQRRAGAVQHDDRLPRADVPRACVSHETRVSRRSRSGRRGARQLHRQGRLGCRAKGRNARAERAPLSRRGRRSPW